jgi:glycosyltransferase involved in cell wall biosynthesis
MKNSKLTLTVGIPAYNEEANIKRLIRSILAQKSKNYNLEKVIIISDGSTDKTNNIVNKISKKNRKVYLIDNRVRTGKTKKINDFFRLSKSDLLVMIDADNLLVGKSVLDEIAYAYKIDKKIGLVALCDIPYDPDGLFESIVNAASYLWKDIRENYKDGKSIHNIHGCAYALSRQFYKNLTIPADVFNDDEYLYMVSRKHKKDFIHLCQAKTYFQLPKNLTDFIAQSARFANSREKTFKYFGNKAKKEFMIPKAFKMKRFINNLITDPFNLASSIFLQILVTLFKNEYEMNYSVGYWNTIKSTK